MIFNLHMPMRQENESRGEYRLRQQASKAAVARMTCAGMSGGTSSRETLRNNQRRNGNLRGTFGASLLAHYAAERREAKEAKAKAKAERATKEAS